MDLHTFSARELVTAMIKAKGIREGIWGLYVEFGISATNLNNGQTLTPAAIVPLVRFGLCRHESESSIAVDAAKVASPIILAQRAIH